MEVVGFILTPTLLTLFNTFHPPHPSAAPTMKFSSCGINKVQFILS